MGQYPLMWVWVMVWVHFSRPIPIPTLGPNSSSAPSQTTLIGVDAVPSTPNIGTEETHETGHSYKGEGSADEQFPNSGVYIAHSVGQTTQRSTRRVAAQSQANVGKLQPWEQVLQL